MFLISCASHRVRMIEWPQRIETLEALSEVDINLKDMRYSGTMALSMDYARKRLVLEVFGPFGDTAVFLKRDESGFYFRTPDEEVRDENVFKEKTGLTVDDFMEDIMRNESYTREHYRIINELRSGGNSLCWEMKDGKICVRFTEARFDR